MKNFLQRPPILYFVFYFGLLSIFRWKFDISLLLLWLGGMVGMGFVWVDRIAHVYFTRPQEQLSVQAKALVGMGRYMESFRAIDQRKNEQRYLTVRSVLFLGVWLILALYVLTSTGSMFASSMIMGIGLSILIQMMMDWKHADRLKVWLFWQIKRDFSDNEARGVVVFFGVIFGLFSLMMI